jgi:hypothetical protein
MVSFETWWNSAVFVDTKKNRFTRKDLVVTLADQDGGAHVDPGLDQKYYELTRQNSLGWHRSCHDGTWAALTNPHYAAVRQISHEVLSTLLTGYKLTTPNSEQVENSAGIKIMGMRLTRGKQGWNDKCLCGSALKFKRCHGR